MVAMVSVLPEAILPPVQVHNALSTHIGPYQIAGVRQHRIGPAVTVPLRA